MILNLLKQTSVSLFFLLFLGTTPLYAQKTFNASGYSATINGMTFDYSIGEMVLVNTANAPSLIVTQGVLQPPFLISSSTPTNETLVNESSLHVYPNPSSSIVFVEFEMLRKGVYTLTLYDGLGKVLQKQTGESGVGLNKLRVQCNEVAAGNYYLLLRVGTNIEISNSYTFQIQKID